MSFLAIAGAIIATVVTYLRLVFSDALAREALTRPRAWPASSSLPWAADWYSTVSLRRFETTASWQCVDRQFYGIAQRLYAATPPSWRPLYFRYMGVVGVAAGGAAGEIAKVSHTFQPAGRFSLANSP